MLEILPDVFVVPANGRKGYGYSHFVKHPGGNILLPRLKQTSLSDAYDDMENAGGVKTILISDRHFGGPGCRKAALRFGAELYASAIESSFMTPCKIDHKLNYEPQTIEGTNIQAIPTPGHTSGQLAYLIDVAGNRCLFAGDFAYRVGGKWQVGNKSRKVMEKGLSHLHGYGFDYYIGCAGYEDPDSFVSATSIDEIEKDILAACTKP